MATLLPSLATPCCSPCCTFQAQKAFSTVPKHLVTLVRSRSASKHVSQWPPCCCTLLLPLLHLPGPESFFYGSEAAVWHLQTLVRSRSAFKHVSQCSYPTLAGPWPPCCPPELPFGTLKPLQGLAAAPSTCQNAASLPLLHRGHPAAQPCCTLLLPLLRLPGPESFFYGSEADVWHPQTLVRSRSAFKHVSQCS